MTVRALNREGLTRLQKALWYVVLVWFGGVCLVYPLDLALATVLSHWGVGLVVVMTGVRIAYLSELFRKAGRKTSWLLTYVLLAVLALTILLKYLR